MPKKNSRTQGFYQKAPAFPLHFSATKSEKLSNNSLNHDKTPKCKGKVPLSKTPVSETIQKMQHGCPTKDPPPVSNMDIGYTAFKRKIYRDVERESSGMAKIRKRLRNILVQKKSWFLKMRCKQILVCVFCANRNRLCLAKRILTGNLVISVFNGITLSSFSLTTIMQIPQWPSLVIYVVKT